MPRKALTRGKLHSLQDTGCSPTVIQPPKRHNMQVDIPTLLRIADSSTASGSKNFKVFPPSVVVWLSILYFFHLIIEMRPYEPFCHFGCTQLIRQKSGRIGRSRLSSVRSVEITSLRTRTTYLTACDSASTAARGLQGD